MRHCRHAALQEFVEHSDTARLDNYIEVFTDREMTVDFVFILRAVHNNSRPLWIRNVTMLLALVCIRLVEGDLSATLGQGTQNAAVVRGSTVPVRGNKARAPDRKSTRLNSSH